MRAMLVISSLLLVALVHQAMSNCDCCNGSPGTTPGKSLFVDWKCQSYDSRCNGDHFCACLSVKTEDPARKGRNCYPSICDDSNKCGASQKAISGDAEEDKQFKKYLLEF